MIAQGWLAALARRALPWIVVAILALACRHYATLATMRAEALARQQAAWHSAQAQAETAARAALAQQQRGLTQWAQTEETRHDEELDQARLAAVHYRAAHRVQPAQPGASPGPATTPTPDHAAGLRPPVPAAGIVVSEPDVQACSEVTAYALALRAWALGLDAARGSDDGAWPGPR